MDFLSEFFKKIAFIEGGGSLKDIPEGSAIYENEDALGVQQPLGVFVDYAVEMVEVEAQTSSDSGDYYEPPDIQETTGRANQISVKVKPNPVADKQKLIDVMVGYLEDMSYDEGISDETVTAIKEEGEFLIISITEDDPSRIEV